MGLLDKIFDKKNCAICGGEIGLLGNRKLADGNLCKECAAKLSPFMTDRRQSTVEEIRRHLAYREQNARILLAVQPTRVFGHNSTKLYLDETKGLFFVTSHNNYIPHNPDVISVSQVIGFRPSIHESRQELYHHDREGKRVPYNPPRYRVEYRFDVALNINSPYFNEISFELSDARPDSPYNDLYRGLEAEVLAMQTALDPSNYQAVAKPAEAPAQPQPVVEQPAAPAPGGWTCPSCGKENNGNFCTNCGTKKPVVFKCDKCGWMPDDPTKLPKFCPNCGDPFSKEEDVE